MKKIVISRFSSYRKKSTKFLLTGLAVLSSLSLLAQNSEVKEASALSLFANPLFDVLLTIIILLLIVMSVLGGALVNVADAVKDKSKTENKNGKLLSALIFIALLSSSKTIQAQETIQAVSTSSYMGLNSNLFYLLIGLIGFELLIILVLINSIKLLVKNEKEEVPVKQEKEVPSLLERFNASVAVEKEHDILLDHNYDGIRELDNDLPPWWKYGFYFTIVFAFIYLVHYHVTATGDLQIAEYNKSILNAQLAKAEFEKTNANNVTESSVKMLTDKDELAKGETIFKENCFACHGKFGEGGVGPNLTDNYWLHGGSIKDIFTTIKYGWPDKGMKSWQADLSPIQINEVASYIKTIRDTNPANGKAPQGDLFVESATPKDSLKLDSTQVQLPKVDSTKVAVN
jgi:cytochrome c oxidase cbb3-type subunit 3